MTAASSHDRRREERRILFVSTVSGLEGGAERSLLDLAGAMARRGWSVSLASWGRGALTEAFDHIGDTFSLDRKSDPASPLDGAMTRMPALEGLVGHANRLRLWLRPIRGESAWLEDVVRRTGATLIHTNCDISPLAASRTSRRTGTPWIAHLRDDWRSWLHPRISRSLRHADVLVAPSEFLANRFRSRGLDPVVVANPVSGTGLRRPVDEATRESLRAELGVSTPFLAAVVGRLGEQKGTLRVVEVGRSLHTRGAGVGFVLAGRGSDPFERELRTSIESAGLDESIRLLGYREDVARWLPAADCMVVPSRGEPFGRMIVEAMHAGLPVVAFRDGAAPEILTDGETGVLVPPGDSEAIAAAVLQLSEDPDRARRIGDAARTAALAYEPARIAEEMEALYLRSVGE